jgi:dihydrofolate reductase
MPLSQATISHNLRELRETRVVRRTRNAMLDVLPHTGLDQDVTVMGGGASLGQQYIAAGLVDENSIHLVPVLFHRGTRMFEHLGANTSSLSPPASFGTDAAIHLRLRVVR